jgi:hypothetical protein
MRFRTVLLAGLIAISSPAARSQVALVKNAPFKATWTRVTKAPAGTSCVSQMLLDEPPYLSPAPMNLTPCFYYGVGVHHEKIEVARASDGSVYEKTTTDGKVASILIYDVQHGREIAAIGNRISITAHPVTILSIPEEHEMLESQQKSSDESTAILTEHMTPLGEKTEKGMTLFGLKSNFKDFDGATSEEEIWTSDTGVTTNLTHTDSNKSSITEKLVSFHAGEPNAGLFQVPKKLPSELNRQYVLSDFGSGFDHFTYPPGGAPQ